MSLENYLGYLNCGQQALVGVHYINGKGNPATPFIHSLLLDCGPASSSSCWSDFHTMMLEQTLLKLLFKEHFTIPQLEKKLR